MCFVIGVVVKLFVCLFNSDWIVVICLLFNFNFEVIEGCVKWMGLGVLLVCFWFEVSVEVLMSSKKIDN